MIYVKKDENDFAKPLMKKIFTSKEKLEAASEVEMKVVCSIVEKFIGKVLLLMI